MLLITISCKKQPEHENKATEKPNTENKIKDIKDTILPSTFETKLIESGVNFYARGHEPSWSLDMDFESNFHFKILNGEEIFVPAVKGDKAMDANVTRFYAEVEKGTLIITIQKENCQDTMADQTFDFSVKVQMKYSSENEYKTFEGCGKYLPDIALHDIWVLDKINGESLSLNPNQERPRFEFFSKKEEVLGYAGCNNFRAKFSISNYKEIYIKSARMTRKSCPDMTYENMLSNHVFGKRLKYSRENLTLNLTGYDGKNFRFKKVD